MAFKLATHVHMTTTTGGDETNPYTLSSVAGYETFASFLSSGDSTWYVCYDGTDYEAGLGFFNGSGQIVRDDVSGGVFQSSNSDQPVEWPGSGTRDIVCGIPSYVFSDDGASNHSILNQALPQGFTVKTSATTALRPKFNAREMRAVGDGAGTEGQGTNVTITNTKGTSGDPTWNTTIDLANLLYRQNSGSAADRTMLEELVLAAVTTRITGFSSNEHIIRDGTSNEDMVKLVQVAGEPEDAQVWIREGGPGAPLWKQALTQGNINSYHPRLLFNSTSTEDAEITLSTPAGVTDYVILGFGSAVYGGVAYLNDVVASVDIQYHTGGGWPGTVLGNGYQRIYETSETSVITVGLQPTAFGWVDGAAANTTYTFRLHENSATKGTSSDSNWKLMVFALRKGDL